MTNEELILERLDRIESQLAPITRSVNSLQELNRDLSPLAHNAFQNLIGELQDVESSVQLEDILELIKRLLRSSKSITYSLKQLENLIDFMTTLEPLLRSSVPKLIAYLDELEQKGVFKILMATLEVRAKVAEAYTAEDIDRIGDGFVAMLSLSKKLAEPQTMAFLERMTDMPAKLDLESSKACGPFGLLWALGNKEVKAGLGVLIELAKGMGRIKPQG
ncbi:MAG: DUF1641 domain-containing protein [Pseudomonadota bacterium]